ncbi:hypothetical protein [Paenibacillus sp. oral taxon 786]|uniref:hypothetical protein n=1 Tax=Paenibacillus sp. oral taxon 786 TaxID=652715 RepID=UPI0018DDBE34|nr:hypothetical protein [Paenibacillus sp. oral taxon 786]
MTLMLALGLINHVFIIPALLQIAKRDAWFSVLLSAVPFALVVCLIRYTSSRIGTQPLPEWIRHRLGRIPAFGFQWAMTAFFFATAWFSLYDTVMWMKVTFPDPIFPDFLRRQASPVCCRDGAGAFDHLNLL